MIKKVLVVVVFLGFAAFIIRNVYFSDVKMVSQQKDVVTREKASNDREVFRGTFDGMDWIHNVKGEAIVYETSQGPILSFEKFSSTPGPDLVVYLSKSENIPLTKNLGGDYVALGRLHKLSGDQVYTLPKNYEEYNSVVIWSRAFSILFGAAPIK